MANLSPDPTDISAKGWLATAKRVGAELSDDHVGLIAAGCAFYGLMAIFPGIVAGMALAGLFTDPTGIVTQLETMTRFIPQDAAKIVIDQAKAVAGSDTGGLGLAALLGIATALFSASAGMAALIEGLNVAFESPQKRGFLQGLSMRLMMTIGMMAGFLLIVAVLIALPVVLGYLPLGDTTELVVTIIRWPVVLLIIMAGLAVLYRHAPARAVRKWRWITPGAGIACLLWLGGSLTFAFYVRNFGSYNETFGTLGGVIVMLMWLWLSSYIILLGAEIDAEMEAQAKQNPQPASADPATADAGDLTTPHTALPTPPTQRVKNAQTHPHNPANQRVTDAVFVAGTIAYVAAALFSERKLRKRDAIRNNLQKPG